MEFDVEKMSKALAECNGGHCPYGCYLFNTAIKDEIMQSRNCLNIANEVIKKLTERIFNLENRLKECENGYEGTLFLESCKLHDAEEKVKELTEENERLRNTMVDYRNISEIIVKTKAATVREFAERLKDCIHPDADHSGYEIREVIDQTAKELLEGEVEND